MTNLATGMLTRSPDKEIYEAMKGADRPLTCSEISAMTGMDRDKVKGVLIRMRNVAAVRCNREYRGRRKTTTTWEVIL